MKNFLAGARFLGSGFGMILRSPKLLALGAVPALLSAVLLLAALGTLLYFSWDITGWLTPFADGWAPGWRIALQVTLVVLLVGAAGLLGSVAFIAITLLIGAPIYEYIAEQAEQRLGIDTSGDGAGAARQLGRGLRDSVKLVLIAAGGSLLLLAIGFIPIVGQVAAPVLGVLFGAWLVAMEMVGLVFQRSGGKLHDRSRMLRQQRGTALGFGMPTYLLCLIPVAQLVVIPSAVVGGTLLAHQLTARAGSGARQETTK